MVRVGDEAPDFTLPGHHDDAIETFGLSDATERGRCVLILFYPFDFSPVCTNELCAIRDAEWFELTPDLDVWGVSGDSTYSHRAFADEYGLNFPLLSDSHGRVADAYGVCYDEWEGHECVPKRAVFLVDTDRTVRYSWYTDDALEKPDFFPVKEALDNVTEDDEFGPSDVDLSVEYDREPGEVEP